MAQLARTRSPDPHWAARDLETRFRVLDHFHELGLVSEVVEHALFSPINACRCTRCRFEESPR